MFLYQDSSLSFVLAILPEPQPYLQEKGYVSMCHNSLLSLMTKLLVSAGYSDVVTEPLLLPTPGVTLPLASRIEHHRQCSR